MVFRSMTAAAVEHRRLLAILVIILVALFVVLLAVWAGGNNFVPTVSLVLGLTGLIIALLSWQANVYGKEWREARARLLTWTRECNEAFELLAPDPASTLRRLKGPPFSYALRAYSHHELRKDLALISGQTIDELWNKDYVERSVVETVATKMFFLTHHWRAVHGFNGSFDKHCGNQDLRELVFRGHMKLCQLEDAIHTYKLCGMFESVVRRISKAWELRANSPRGATDETTVRHLDSALDGGIGDPTHIWMDS